MDRILSKVFIDKTPVVDTDQEMTLEINEKPVNPILKEYAEKYTPEELTADGIPTIETQLKELSIKDEELKRKFDGDCERLKRRELVQRVKCLSLNSMGKDFMMNTYNLSEKERKKLQEIMYSYNDVPHDEIISNFNEMVTETLFENPKIDISTLPIYHV